MLTLKVCVCLREEGETGIATDCVVECVVEFLWFAKCLAGGGT